MRLALKRLLAPVILCLLALGASASAEDWPEWRGKGRRGEWNETGILGAFPRSGLRVLWRAPIGAGYAGPAVAARRVYVTDFQPRQRDESALKDPQYRPGRASGLTGSERLHCLEEATGKVLWTQGWEADYTGIMQSYASGPRATPTVDGDRVYVQGGGGSLVCLNAATGAVLWKKEYVKEYGTQMPVWGMTSSPLVDGNRLVAVVGGSGNAKVMAFDKTTGRELWRALSSEQSEPGYCQPMLVEAGGTRQLIVWHPVAVTSLDPATGAIHWEQPFKIQAGLTVATPVQNGARLFVSAFYNGPMMLELDPKRPGATLLWKGKSNSEVDTDGLHSLVSTPVIDGDYIYGICSYGQFRCLKTATGERVWETLDVTGEKARWATGFLVKNGDRYFINNDRGDLIIARLSPQGYQEVSRAQLIKPTSTGGIGRRQLGAVNWSHPAYANRHVYARNDEEIIAVSLEK
jgi:outer membrane protein assembly factor BamB